MKGEFKSAWWLANGNMQTLLAPIFQYKPSINAKKTLAINSQPLNVTWINAVNETNQDKPIVVLLHGILASIDSPYIRSISHTLTQHNFPTIFLHYRSDNGLASYYNDRHTCNDIEDLESLVDYLQQHFPNNPIHIIGYSWGGNVLLRYLSNDNHTDKITKSVAVSVAFDLDKTAQSLLNKSKRLYHFFMMKQLKSNLNKALKPSVSRKDRKSLLSQMNSIQDYEKLILAPMYGYQSLEHYYHDTCVNNHLSKIGHDVLIIHSLNDPIIPAETIPKPEALSNSLSLELYKDAGHIGFITTKNLLLPSNWLDQRILDYLQK